ncbi:MAG: hypothetical protein V1793_20310 [Pseudomonadota bacterium]
MTQFVKLFVLGVFVLLATVLTGCVSTLTERPYWYDMPSDKAQYVNLDKYSAVYALTQSSGWNTRVSAVLFDFKGDDLTLKPPAKPVRKNESWVKVTTREKLEAAMKDMDSAALQLITFRPCFRCDRSPVGAFFSQDFILLTYNEADNTMEFKKLDAIELESGGDGGAGGG